MKPKLWLVAGPNGAGKSTIVQLASIQQVLPGVAIWNPDTVARELLQAQGYSGFSNAPFDAQREAFLRAAHTVSSLLDDCVSHAIPVGVEKVLSTDKYKPLVERIIAESGFFGLIYIFLSSPELACQRVAQRVLEGGHTVPEDKVRSRWSESLANLPWFASRSSKFFVFDNSDSNADVEAPLVAYGAQGKVRKLLESAPGPILRGLGKLPRETTN